MPAQALYTIGYSGHDPDSFMARLAQARIEVVVDVRQNPVSRKRGFSRKALQQHLAQNGIDYVHMPALGVPRPLRDQLREAAISRADYLSAFRRHLATETAALEELCTRAVKQRCCLVCMESRPEECHRSVVADLATHLAGRQQATVHL
jgi:uncharacterized protein (DUF488 family)